MIALRESITWSSTVPVAAEVVLTPDGAHTGLLYRNAIGELRVLDLAFHYRLRHQPAATWSGASVVTTLDPVQAELVAAYSEMMSQLVGHAIPYAFRYTDGGLTQGRYVGGTDHGLTCSTFVLAVVLAASGVELLDRASWQPRAADLEAHQRLLGELERWQQQGRVTPAHVEAVRREQGCMRYRPVEAAAASAMRPHPVHFNAAEPAGDAVLAQLGVLFR